MQVKDGKSRDKHSHYKTEEDIDKKDKHIDV